MLFEVTPCRLQGKFDAELQRAPTSIAHHDYIEANFTNRLYRFTPQMTRTVPGIAAEGEALICD